MKANTNYKATAAKYVLNNAKKRFLEDAKKNMNEHQFKAIEATLNGPCGDFLLISCFEMSPFFKNQEPHLQSLFEAMKEQAALKAMNSLFKKI